MDRSWFETPIKRNLVKMLLNCRKKMRDKNWKLVYTSEGCSRVCCCDLWPCASQVFSPDLWYTFGVALYPREGDGWEATFCSR
jgi:hypothetical protein